MNENSLFHSAKPVAYSGITGAYSEEALFALFGKNASTLPLDSFSAVFDAIKSGHSDFGVVPVENSSTGFIAAATDLLGECGLYITGEYVLDIHHCLVALEGTRIENIREIYSHEQALLQCDRFLKSSLPNARRIPYYNTAASARFVADSKDHSKAAIASAHAARAWGLTVLASDIQTSRRNQTRFVCIGRDLRDDGNCNKASLYFSVKHESGSLLAVLTHLAKRGLNMTKLESRPVPGIGFEYCFYMDFICEGGIDAVKELVNEISKNCISVRLLGFYPSQEQK